MHLTHQLKGATGIYGLKQISETARLVHQLVQDDVALEELQAAISELVDMCKQAAVQQPRDSLDRQTISARKSPRSINCSHLVAKGSEVNEERTGVAAEYGSRHDRTANSFIQTTASAALRCSVAALRASR